MSLRSMLDRSRDALYALTAFNPVGVERVEDVGTGLGMGSSGEQLYGPVVGGMNGLLGGNDLRNVMFWAAIAVVLLLLAALSNPNENSFRSHLTELSFRRHLVDIRATDSLNSSSADHPDTESTTHAHPVTVIPASHSTSTPAPTPFRFANHVAINLRTPPMLYRSHWFFSTGVTTPLTSPSILALSDPMSVLRRVRDKERDRSTVFIGFFGHWSPVTINLVSDLIIAVLGDGREKGKRRERPGILDVKALSAKDDAPASKALPLAPKLLKSEPATEPLAPPTPPPSSSRRPSLGQPAPDAADSPLVVSLKADLTSAQLTLSDLKHQLQLHESSTDSTLTSTLEELRNRRKEDDAERQELKSKTKSLEEQKRQAESARRDAEKKLRAVEALRDGLESKIAAARAGAVETRENMDQSERNVRSIQEEGARHVVETLDNVESKRKELSRMEAELVDLESRNEHLAELVKEAEDRLKVATESGARASPEEEMMMMAAAYEAAAQEGYLSQTQNQWAHQAAAYMAEAGMPYLGQDYTARPTTRTTTSATTAVTTTANQQHHDLTGFEDFGPGVRDRPKPQPPFDPPLAPLGHSATAPPPSAPFSHSTNQQVRSLDIHTPEAVEEEGVDEIGPGSPNGISFLPQGLFRSLEGDATPLDLEGQESGGSDSGDELWRSPRPEHSLPVSASESRRLLPPSSTTPPAAAGSGPVPATGVGAGAGPGPVLPAGLPALPGPRRWFSGSGSAANSISGSASVENLGFSFMQPPGTISNDSLVNFDPSRPSPFAPSASEKNALKWPLSRWARGNNPAAAPPNAATTAQSTPDASARSSSVDLGNGSLPTSIPGPNGNGTGTGKSTSSSGNWFSSSRFGTSPSNRSVSATERSGNAQDAFSTFNSSSNSTVTGGGFGMFGKRNLDAGNGNGATGGQDKDSAGGNGNGIQVVDENANTKPREGTGNISLNSNNTSTTDDEDQTGESEKKFSRFFRNSLRKTPSSTS